MAAIQSVVSNRVKSYDYLGVVANNNVAKALSRFKDGPEEVQFSDFIVKINPRDKPQERVLVITNRAVYNLLPSDYSKCKRRIPLAAIERVTISEISDEFVLHIPSEYDYRMMSLRKREVVECLNSVYQEITSKKLEVEMSRLIVLKSLCVTKGQAKKSKRHEFSIPRFGRGSRASTSESTSSAGSFANANDGDIATDMAKMNISSKKGHQRTDTGSSVTGWGTEHTEVRPEDFKLLKVIGRGSFGKVMLVNKKNENKTYAMKVLKKQAIVDRNQVEHTKAEREILVEIDHPFLMKLHYAFQTSSKLYFVMDYLTGGELFFHLKNARRFTEERARFYTAEIALGLGHLHSKDIFYRDLKPENILLDSDGHVRLTDFGLSKKFDGQQAQTFCGTPEYLAPEVISGAGHGKEVDWWSLGILLYEMLVGIPPFYSENVNLMYDLIQRSDLRIPSIVSVDARNVICGLLVRNPDSRLGCGTADVEAIKATPFFREIDWNKLLNKEIAPPFVPQVSGDNDTSNFDEEFTSEPVVDSVVPPSAIDDAKNNFENFTYVPSSMLDNNNNE